MRCRALLPGFERGSIAQMVFPSVVSISKAQSTFSGLRLVEQDGAVTIDYPARIHPVGTAMLAAESLNMRVTARDSGLWRIESGADTLAMESLRRFFTTLNGRPASYARCRFSREESPLVSCVIVVNENLPFVHDQLLPSIAENSRESAIEVVIVCNGTVDDTADVGAVKRVRSEWGRVSAAYNCGASAATGQHLAFFHDDCIIDDPQWIQKCLEALDRGNTVVAGEYRHLETIAGLRIPTLPIAKAVPLFIQAAAFKTLGGFDEFHYVGYEDLDFTLSILASGGKVAYPHLTLRHFNGMSSTLKYCPVEGLGRLYALGALPRHAIRARFREFMQQGIVRGGVDLMRLALDVQLLYILRKHGAYLRSAGEANYDKASDALSRMIGRISPVDATRVLPLFRETDRLLYGQKGAAD